MVATSVIVKCPGRAIPTWRKILHAFLDRQAQPDVWFQRASSCSRLLVGGKLRSPAEETAAQDIARETHGNSSAQVSANWICGGWRRWLRGPAWFSQVPAAPPTASPSQSSAAPELLPTYLQVRQTQHPLEHQTVATWSVVVKALCYKPEGRWFETGWYDFFFKFT
jgi:hypothetical protein